MYNEAGDIPLGHLSDFELICIKEFMEYKYTQGYMFLLKIMNGEYYITVPMFRGINKENEYAIYVLPDICEKEFYFIDLSFYELTCMTFNGKWVSNVETEGCEVIEYDWEKSVYEILPICHFWEERTTQIYHYKSLFMQTIMNEKHNLIQKTDIEYSILVTTL